MLTRLSLRSSLRLAVCSPALLLPVFARAQNAPTPPARIVDAQQDFAARLAKCKKTWTPSAKNCMFPARPS